MVSITFLIVSSLNMDILTRFRTVRLAEQSLNWSDYGNCINIHSNSPAWYMCQAIRISIDIGQWLRHSNLKCQLHTLSLYVIKWPSWPWSYGSWIYNYLCNQCLSPLMLWVRISIRARCTTLCDKFVSDFSSFPQPIKLTATIYTEILWKVALNTFKQTNNMQSWLKSVIVWYINEKYALSMSHCDLIWVRLNNICVTRQPMSYS
jgi:hypothetical protein